MLLFPSICVATEAPNGALSLSLQFYLVFFTLVIAIVTFQYYRFVLAFVPCFKFYLCGVVHSLCCDPCCVLQLPPRVRTFSCAFLDVCSFLVIYEKLCGQHIVWGLIWRRLRYGNSQYKSITFTIAQKGTLYMHILYITEIVPNIWSCVCKSAQLHFCTMCRLHYAKLSLGFLGYSAFKNRSNISVSVI